MVIEYGLYDECMIKRVFDRMLDGLTGGYLELTQTEVKILKSLYEKFPSFWSEAQIAKFDDLQTTLRQATDLVKSDLGPFFSWISRAFVDTLKPKCIEANLNQVIAAYSECSSAKQSSVLESLTENLATLVRFHRQPLNHLLDLAITATLNQGLNDAILLRSTLRFCTSFMKLADHKSMFSSILPKFYELLEKAFKDPYPEYAQLLE